MPFSKLIGVELEEATASGVVGQLTARPDLCTSGNILHGGAVMSFADALGAIAAGLNLPEGASGTITLESKTNFVRATPAGSRITGTSVPLHIGRRVSVWQTDISGVDGKRVATVTQTQLVL
jgi:uncharacterized protein (TIGR00369 family)